MIISMTAAVDDLIADGQAALQTGNAAAARSSFGAALSLGPNSAAVEGLGFAAYLAADFDETIDLWQQSYSGYRADGNGAGAVRVARMLGFMYGIVVGGLGNRIGMDRPCPASVRCGCGFLGEGLGGPNAWDV